MDISGNSAVQLTRKVVVSDKQCPKITLKGKNTVTSEAGFPYKDAGATAFDALDGDLTAAVWTDGDTINVGKDFKQIHVWCDMKSHKKGKKAAGYTYKLLPSGKKCSDFGLEAPKTITKFAQQKFGKATLCAMNDEDVALDYGRKVHAPHSHPGT